MKKVRMKRSSSSEVDEEGDRVLVTRNWESIGRVERDHRAPPKTHHLALNESIKIELEVKDCQSLNLVMNFENLVRVR